MSRPARTLDQLPTEILALILEKVQDGKSLRSCCLVSRRFNDISERELYRAVNILYLTTARRFLVALRLRPARLSYLRNLRIISSKSPMEYAAAGYWSSMMICPTLLTCPNLEHLSLASHYCDDDSLPDLNLSVSDHVRYYQFDLYEMLRRASLHTPPNERVLTKLTTLRLHFKLIAEMPRWEPSQDVMHIFLSPTLREISLHRCQLENAPRLLDKLRYADFKGSTPLETLRLRDTWVSVDVVRQILSLPRGLKTFVLEENEDTMDPTDPDDPGPFADLSDWTSLLSQQKHSLEEVAFLVEFEFLDRFRGFLDFRGLERLRLLAGAVLESEDDNVKWLPHVKTMNSHAYTTMLDQTRPDWMNWDLDTDVYDDSEGGLEFYHGHEDDIYSDLDDMDMEDYDENGAWIFET